MKTEIAALLLEKYGKNNPPAVKPGDTVRVYQKIKEGDKERVQIFEGLVIALKHGKGLNGTFTVRKIAAGGIGVERTYPLHSPNIVKVERVKSADVSRAKLYYMRDRLGKSARFKGEIRTPMTWSENAVVPEITPAEEGTPEEENEIAMEEVVAEIEAPEESAVEVEETPEVVSEVEPEVAAEEVKEEEVAE